jgi:hypothetical protein
VNEEPKIDIQTEADDRIFHICHRISTVKDMIRFHNNEHESLPLLHHSILLNKLNNLVRADHRIDGSEFESAK